MRSRIANQQGLIASRRDCLRSTGDSIGLLALTSLFGREAVAFDDATTKPSVGGELPIRDDGGLHHAPKV